MQFPEGGGKKIYSCNEGNSPNWDLPILDYINWCKDASQPLTPNP